MWSSTPEDVAGQERIAALKKAVTSARPAVCPERALIWTEYHRKAANRRKPPMIQMAEALAQVLDRKSIFIYPDELIVGNYTSKRVGGSIYPELHGVPVRLDLLRFARRKTNPLAITGAEIRRLMGIIPFWAPRFMALKAYASKMKTLRLVANQLRAHFYLINEAGGVSHFAPDYARLVAVGTQGIIAEARRYREVNAAVAGSRDFYDGVVTIAEALERFGRRYAALARQMAAGCADERRRRELVETAHVCDTCLSRGAESLHSALQAVFFAQIALNLESLDNAVCPGRMDQYLYRFYRQDLDSGALTPAAAKTLVAAFCIKMAEIVPVFSHHLTRFHGGMFNGQVVTVGGTDARGRDATNDLTYLFLDVMDELRLRQPNFHARVHRDAPAKYLDTLYAMLARGANSPALYNDDVIVETMVRHGYAREDALDYTAVGCVEPVCQGKSFSSTDAALFNVPIVLELALNQGRRFNSLVRSGARTKPVERMQSMAEVSQAFETQLAFMLGQLIDRLQAIEQANRRVHPTPLTSMLLDGCLASGRCSTAGGATYNFSGIQCVGPVDTGDALYAIEKAVFKERRYSLRELVDILRDNFKDGQARAYLRGLAKFGNDIADVDRWSLYVVDRFVDTLATFGRNTRGGAYTAGLYSVTAHAWFGEVTGALPHGRRKKEPFASGIAPLNGMDRSGPTA
ncbi:MAG: pyruvate formate lyase family protein, partial [Desulfosarcinaceae bacterium]